VENELTIETDWENSASGTPEEASTFAAVGIKYGSLWLTEAEDSFVNRIRQKVYLSAYPLAEWLAWNWWRLRWEPRRPTHDWLMAHRMSNIGGGYVWPDITIFSDGERVVLNSVPTRPRAAEPLRYISQAAAIVRAPVFEDVVDTFISAVLDQLGSKQVADTNLMRIWKSVSEERNSHEVALRRRLEALLGFDVDEADENLIERLVNDSDKLGEAGVQEIAATATPAGMGAVASSNDIIAAANAYGFSCNPRDSVQLRASIAGGLPTGVAAWKRGVAAAHALRDQENLGSGPISNERLCQLVGVTSAVLQTQSRAPYNFEYDTKQTQGRIALKSSYETGRRFSLARLLGDKLAAGTVNEPFKLAAKTFTYRQKMQRAFAGEFLCPFDELSQALDGDFSDDAIQDAARHFNVSDIAVRTLLVNNHAIDRDHLLIDDFDVPQRATAA
jgi:hypothetical protein